MKAKQANTLLFGVITSLIVIILMIIVYIVFLSFQPEPEADIPEYLVDNGITVIDPPLEIPGFRLTDQNNNTVRLGNLRGRPALVSFGYTHCPDVCPITLGEFRNIHEELGDNADSLNFVFVSVDGERDTPEVLTIYFETLRVSEFVTGMTGTENQLQAIAVPLGVEYIRHEADQFGNYNVDHTAGMFLLDENGNWIRRYRYGIRSTLIAEDIQEILNN